MTTQRLTIEEAAQLIEARNADKGYCDVFAVRGSSVIPDGAFAPSRIWIDGSATDDVLPGVCALSVDRAGCDLDGVELRERLAKQVNASRAYGTRAYLLLGEIGDNMADETGRDIDVDEVLLWSHEVVAEII